MKKFILGSIIAIFCIFSSVEARRGAGSSFAGGMAGSMVGSMIGSAMTSKSGSSDRAEREARFAQEKAEQAQREQHDLKMDMLKSQMQEQRGGMATNMMILGLFIMFLIILGMFFMMMKMKHKK